MTDAEWEVLEPKVPAVKDGGRPALYPRRDIVDAIFYVNRTGCSWRSLPADFPHWMTVYSYFREWKRSGVYERINDAFRSSGTRSGGQECCANCRHHRFAQRQDLRKRGVRGYDGGKKIKGRKRHV
ncbi:transposase, partial [Deinococcus sp.]|uniref:transposase n=1 Tax=Deinococcus sp. TaxID=47478 RepID=UPI0038D3E763